MASKKSVEKSKLTTVYVAIEDDRGWWEVAHLRVLSGPNAQGTIRVERGPARARISEGEFSLTVEEAVRKALDALKADVQAARYRFRMANETIRPLLKKNEKRDGLGVRTNR